jgi:hypothetical protein
VPTASIQRTVDRAASTTSITTATATTQAMVREKGTMSGGAVLLVGVAAAVQVQIVMMRARTTATTTTMTAMARTTAGETRILAFRCI